jgi:hypothetical protein
MIKLGDKVRFLNENMEGIVTSMKGKNQIGVTIDSDFEIPVLISEVVKINFDDKAGNTPSNSPAKPFRVANNNPLGVFLAFERQGEVDLEISLHNNFSEYLTVVVYQKIQGVFHLYKTLQLERDQTLTLGKTQLNQFDQWPSYHFTLVPYEDTTVSILKTIQSELNFQAKTFHQYWKHCFFLQKQAYVFKLDEPLEKLNLQALKQKDFSEKTLVQAVDLKSVPNRIVDLHYESLQQNGYGSATDITAFQMEVFTKTLEAAFVNKMPEMVYIHGVGNAYLKNKIRTYLSKHPEMILNFEDADILQFGGGATLVRLK